MASILGLGGINKNKKLKEEVERIDKDINELFKEFIEPMAPLLHPISIEKATNLIKGILKDIEQHKKLLDSYNYNLHSFSEIYQLENSIKELLKILEEVDKQRHNPHQKINYNSITKNIKIELLKIRDSWNRHKYVLHQLGIIKIKP